MSSTLTAVTAIPRTLIAGRWPVSRSQTLSAARYGVVGRSLEGVEDQGEADLELVDAPR
jgi:hypothetical protein